MQRCDYCAVIPDFYPVIPAKAGMTDVGSQARHTKSSTNTNRRIPSPFMGSLHYAFPKSYSKMLTRGRKRSIIMVIKTRKG